MNKTKELFCGLTPPSPNRLLYSPWGFASSRESILSGRTFSSLRGGRRPDPIGISR